VGLKAEEVGVKYFLAECCDLGQGLSVTSVALYAGYRAWCDSHRRPAATPSWLGRELRRVPGVRLERVGHRNIRTWHGLGLRKVPHAPAPPSSLGDVLVSFLRTVPVPSIVVVQRASSLMRGGSNLGRILGSSSPPCVSMRWPAPRDD
jgi:hypothetical protein